MDYKSSGVDINAGYISNELIKKHVEATRVSGVLGSLGGFAGAFSLSSLPNFSQMKKPVLISGTDGVGTKLKIAFLMDVHDSVGIDCVAMCVNDIICAGAKPLIFLDYIACGKNHPYIIEQIVKGVADGCVLAGAALVGGETAEMPGFYPEGEYDLAGFSVGIVDEENMITGNALKAGDVIIGIASSGVHSNGFSLIRKVFLLDEERVNTYVDELGQTLGESLLTPTKIYVKAFEKIKEAGVIIKAASNITGGGFYENIPRMLKEGLCAKIELGGFLVPPIFKLLQTTGKIDDQVMYNTYNMGIGMCICVDKADTDGAIKAIEASGEKAYVIGELISGDKGVILS